MVSVIIRNRNEEEFIGFAIQSVIDHIPDAEIIIVDNHSTDSSLEIVNLFKDRIDIRVVTIDDYTPGKSINMGVGLAKYDTILVLSAHAQITDINLEMIKTQLQIGTKYQGFVAVMGQQNPIYKGKKISKRYIWSHFKDKPIENLYSEIEGRYFLHNAFCFYPKEILLNYPMPEQYPGKEDRYWIKDMIKKGYHFSYNPTIKCNHYYTKNGATWKGIG